MATDTFKEVVKSKFIVHFDSDYHVIDNDTLVEFLMSFSNTIHAINDELDKSKQIAIKITALKPGSFQIGYEFQQVVDALMLMLPEKYLSYFSNLITTVGGLYAIRKFLQGAVPKSVQESGDRVTIENEEGKKVTVDRKAYKIHSTNEKVNKSITRQFDILDADPEVKGFKVRDLDGNEIINVPATDFLPISIPNPEVEPAIKYDDVFKSLSVVRISFESRLKSDFILEGKSISAQIKDEAFYQRVVEGERFGIGDVLQVYLRIWKKYDQRVDTYVIKSYEIITVINHFPRPDANQLEVGD